MRSSRCLFFLAILCAAPACSPSSGDDAAVPASDAAWSSDTMSPPPNDAASSAVLAACASGPSGPDQDCGWAVVRAWSCTPGASVHVGCSAACAPPLGACTGDPMLRVCPGEAPCTRDAALVGNDDSSECPDPTGASSLCSTGSFVCPPEGRYVVLTASSDAQPYTCTVAVR
jgi:hypothetical protein